MAHFLKIEPVLLLKKLCIEYNNYLSKHQRLERTRAAIQFGLEGELPVSAIAAIAAHAALIQARKLQLLCRSWFWITVVAYLSLTGGAVEFILRIFPK